MKTRCINLKDFEVRGLLDGSITALWRPVKPALPSQEAVKQETGSGFTLGRAPSDEPGAFKIYGPVGTVCDLAKIRNDHRFKCPYGQPGDALICRERHAIWYDGARRGTYYWIDQGAMHQVSRWKGAQQMPVWASRIRRELVAVECRQVQTVSENEAKETGVRQTELLQILGMNKTEWLRGYIGGFAEQLEFSYSGAWLRNDWFWKLTLKSE